MRRTISGNLTGPIVLCDGSQVAASSDDVVTVAVAEGATVSCVWFTTQRGDVRAEPGVAVQAAPGSWFIF